MSTENWSQDVLLVCLPPGPKTVNELELESVTDTVRDRGDCDVVIDFSSVDTLTFVAIEKLLTLHNILTNLTVTERGYFPESGLVVSPPEPLTLNTFAGLPVFSNCSACSSITIHLFFIS